MSVQQFFDALSHHTSIIVLYFFIIFVVAFGLSFTHRSSPSHFKAVALSTVIHLVSIPGLMSLIVVFYNVFFTQTNLLEVNMAIYFLPIIAMIATFFAISQYTKLNALPGFNRLSGLMLLLSLTCICVLLLYKLRLFVGFFASIQSLVIFGIILYFLFGFAVKKIKGKR